MQNNLLSVCGQPLHLQGFAPDQEHGVMYWSFTETLVKTDFNNQVIRQVTVPGGHLGDLAFHRGRIFGTQLGAPLPGHAWDDWTGFYLLEFDEELILRHKTELTTVQEWYDRRDDPLANPFGINGVDGVTVAPDSSGQEKILLGAGICSRPSCDRQVILQFSLEKAHRFERLYSFPVGNTPFGIQNLTYDSQTHHCWFSCYGPECAWQICQTLFEVALEPEKTVGKWRCETPYGLAAMGDGEFLISRESGENGDKSGFALTADYDAVCGLVAR